MGVLLWAVMAASRPNHPRPTTPQGYLLEGELEHLRGAIETKIRRLDTTGESEKGEGAGLCRACGGGVPGSEARSVRTWQGKRRLLVHACALRARVVVVRGKPTRPPCHGPRAGPTWKVPSLRSVVRGLPLMAAASADEAEAMMQRASLAGRAELCVLHGRHAVQWGSSRTTHTHPCFV